MDQGGTLRETVRAHYSAKALATSACCETGSCHKGSLPEEVAALPDEAVMGLGCGSPTASAALRPGETVVDLGSGAGLDVFLAAHQVGLGGRVIGVDMTEAMLARAQASAARLGLRNVEFRHGLIEALPLPDASVDVILSNCVINLAPDKAAVFREAFRVLKAGGRLVISDMVATVELPKEIRDDPDLWASCIGGAIPEDAYLDTIRKAGFVSVEVLTREGLEHGQLYSATIRAMRPSTKEKGEEDRDDEGRKVVRDAEPLHIQ